MKSPAVIDMLPMLWSPATAVARVVEGWMSGMGKEER